MLIHTQVKQAHTLIHHIVVLITNSSFCLCHSHPQQTLQSLVLHSRAVLPPPLLYHNHSATQIAAQSLQSNPNEAKDE